MQGTRLSGTAQSRIHCRETGRGVVWDDWLVSVTGSFKLHCSAEMFCSIEKGSRWQHSNNNSLYQFGSRIYRSSGDSLPGNYDSFTLLVSISRENGRKRTTEQCLALIFKRIMAGVSKGRKKGGKQRVSCKEGRGVMKKRKPWRGAPKKEKADAQEDVVLSRKKKEEKNLAFTAADC